MCSTRYYGQEKLFMLQLCNLMFNIILISSRRPESGEGTTWPVHPRSAWATGLGSVYLVFLAALDWSSG